MKYVALFMLVNSLGSLVYVLLHLDLLPTALPVRPEAAMTVQCALSFVVFGINGVGTLWQMHRYQRGA